MHGRPGVGTWQLVPDRAVESRPSVLLRENIVIVIGALGLSVTRHFSSALWLMLWSVAPPTAGDYVEVS